jgi:hypothetical protein
MFRCARSSWEERIREVLGQRRFFWPVLSRIRCHRRVSWAGDGVWPPTVRAFCPGFVRGLPAFFQPDGRLGARRGVRDGASAASSIPESPTPRARSTTPRASSVEPRASTPPVFFPLPALSPSAPSSATTASATGRSPPVTPTPTPALPLVFYPILSSLSIAMFILMLSLMGVILDSRYSCDQYTKVGVALLGVTVIYFVDIVLYWLLVYMGWRGTPLNESKRMPQMAILGMWLISILDGRKNSSLGHHHHHTTT